MVQHFSGLILLVIRERPNLGDEDSSVHEELNVFNKAVLDAVNILPMQSTELFPYSGAETVAYRVVTL